MTTKKRKGNAEYHPPKCSRFKTQSFFDEASGHFTWDFPTRAETENLIGVLDYVHDTLHWKPKTYKIAYRDIKDEEIQELYDKCKQNWRSLWIKGERAS